MCIRDRTIADHPCVTVTCSHCGEALDDDGAGRIVHYNGLDAALRDAVDSGWVQDGDRLLCKSCAGEIVCARDGHSWKHHHTGPYTAYDGRILPAHDYWTCEVCGEFADDDPGVTPAPGPDHPTLLDVPATPAPTGGPRHDDL